MIKYRLYFDKDEETEWLNELSAQGWALKKFFAGFYSFEACEPGKYTYQVDFGEHLFHIGKDYKDFMEDTGVEIVQAWGYWIILRKLTANGPFELYTDVDSSIAHYSKIRNMFRGVSILLMLCLFFELFAGISGVSVGYICACIIGAMLFAIVNVLFKTNTIIANLKEKKGEAEAPQKCRYVSPLLPCGLLLNACALIIDESVSQPIWFTIEILAIILMLVGICKTARMKSSKDSSQ